MLYKKPVRLKILKSCLDSKFWIRPKPVRLNFLETGFTHAHLCTATRLYTRYTACKAYKHTATGVANNGLQVCNLLHPLQCSL